jgi:hypothetical protein
MYDPSGQFTLPEIVIVAVLTPALCYTYNRTYSFLRRRIDEYYVHLEPGENSFRTQILSRVAGIQAQFSEVVPTTIMETQVSPYPHGYNGAKRTLDVSVDYDNLRGPGHSYGFHISIGVEYLRSLRQRENLTEEEITNVAVNVLMHEMVHSLCDNRWLLLHGFDHEKTGLMKGTTWPVVGFRIADLEEYRATQLPFSNPTKKRLERCVGKRW